MIPVHDHDKKPEGGIFCPLMKEMCHNGWTESMGLSDEKLKIKPTCVRWVGVFVQPQGQPIKEVFDCKDRWEPDLIQQVAQEVYQGAVATEQVRNQMAESNGATRIMFSFLSGIAKRMKAHVVLPELKKDPAAPQIENSKGE